MANEQETQPTEDSEETYRLSLIQVESVGLVMAGANEENWFILKSAKESPMDDNMVIEPVAEDVAADPSFWEKVKAFVTETVAKAGSTRKADKQALADAARILSDGGYPVSADDLGEMLMDEEAEDEMEMGRTASPGDQNDKRNGPKGKEDKMKKDDETGVESAPADGVIAKAIEDRLAELQKAQTAQIEAIEKALEEKYKGQLEALQKQADEARTEVEKAVEAREKREWLEKAEAYLALPVVPQEAANHLHAIAKAAPDHIEWLESLLKAADHSLTEAGLFGERGTSRVAEEVEAVKQAEQIAQEKNIPLAEAMLELPVEKQREIAKSFIEGGKR